MPLPTVSVIDLEKFAFQGLDGFKPEYVESLAKSAVLTLQARWGSVIQKRLDSGVLDPHLYQQVIANAVLRIVNNPQGYTMEQAGAYQYQMRATVASGYLFFTEDELDTLLGINRKSRLPGTIGVGLYGQS